MTAQTRRPDNAAVHDSGNIYADTYSYAYSDLDTNTDADSQAHSRSCGVASLHRAQPRTRHRPAPLPRRRLPRTRGDRPVLLIPVENCARGSPARAGIDRMETVQAPADETEALCVSIHRAKLRLTSPQDPEDERSTVGSPSAPQYVTGRPCVSGTRIPVYQLLRMLACGDGVADLLREYPSVTRADILACFDYAASLAAERVDAARGPGRYNMRIFDENMRRLGYGCGSRQNPHSRRPRRAKKTVGAVLSVFPGVQVQGRPCRPRRQATPALASVAEESETAARPKRRRMPERRWQRGVGMPR